MTAFPSSALLGQFAGDITPAGQAVFGLKAQPFTDNHGAVLCFCFSTHSEFANRVASLG